MAVCLFTFHGYGTWWPDRPRGYTTVEDGVLESDPVMGDVYRAQAKFDPVEFDGGIQRVLVAGGADICGRRNWRLHAVGTDPTHAHYLISRQENFEFTEVRDKLKNVLSLFLGRYTKITNRTWFAHGGSNKQVGDRHHFDHLVNVYLPSQRGFFWKEGQDLPKIPNGIL
jgi:hypothetical protein